MPLSVSISSIHVSSLIRKLLTNSGGMTMSVFSKTLNAFLRNLLGIEIETPISCLIDNGDVVAYQLYAVTPPTLAISICFCQPSSTDRSGRSILFLEISTLRLQEGHVA